MLLLVVLFPVKLIQKPPTGALSCMLLIICNVKSFFILGNRTWLHFIFHFSIFLVSTGTFFLRGLFFFFFCILMVYFTLLERIDILHYHLSRLSRVSEGAGISGSAPLSHSLLNKLLQNESMSWQPHLL